MSIDWYSLEKDLEKEGFFKEDIEKINKIILKNYNAYDCMGMD